MSKSGDLATLEDEWMEAKGKAQSAIREWGKCQVPGGRYISQTTKKLINKRRETWDRVRRA